MDEGWEHNHLYSPPFFPTLAQGFGASRRSHKAPTTGDRLWWAHQ